MPHNWSKSSFSSFSTSSAMIAVTSILVKKGHLKTLYLCKNALIFSILNSSKRTFELWERNSATQFTLIWWCCQIRVIGVISKATAIIADLAENEKNEDTLQLCGICWKCYYILFQIPMLLFLWPLDTWQYWQCYKFQSSTACQL